MFLYALFEEELRSFKSVFWVLITFILFLFPDIIFPFSCFFGVFDLRSFLANTIERLIHVGIFQGSIVISTILIRGIYVGNNLIYIIIVRKFIFICIGILFKFLSYVLGSFFNLYFF